VQLLSAIRDVFGERTGKGGEKIASHDLATLLCGREGEPWSDWNQGKGMNADRLARALKKYQIYPKTMRLEDGGMLKGYERASFSDLWARYCPQILDRRQKVVTAVTTPMNTGDSPDYEPSQSRPVTAWSLSETRVNPTL
jgi:hypothetical protein